MKILAIDTSCDETAAAVTNNLKVVSNIIWSQASEHANFGGVMPSLAQRLHKERLDWVIKKALKTSKIKAENLDAIAVTIGPGLAIALGVGIDKVKEIAKKYNKKIIPVNHIEAHLLSSLANLKTKYSNSTVKFPAYGLVTSGGNTIFVFIEKIGKYIVLAQTVDDALGEALDKGARLLGLGYPGGAILEKFAKEGNRDKYKLPTPLIDDRDKNRFSYSGLKTAFVRLVESIENPTKEEIYNLAASYQNTAFEHVIKVLDYQIHKNDNPKIKSLLFGGGVANNIEFRKKLRKLCKKHNLKLQIPYSNKLLGDNAGMIGVSAYLKTTSGVVLNSKPLDRDPRLKL